MFLIKRKNQNKKKDKKDPIFGYVPLLCCLYLILMAIMIVLFIL